MKKDHIFEPLLFSQKWWDLGIVTSEMVKRFESEYNAGVDRNKEHYRWRAYTDFLKNNSTLSRNTFMELYKLGEKDPDETMGGSMMRELLNRKDCPSELIEMSLNSNRDFLVKAAHWARRRQEAQKS